MLRFVSRMIGFGLMAAAFAALIVDGTRSIAARRAMMFSLGDTAAWLWPAALTRWEDAAGQGPAILVFTLKGLLGLPTGLVIAVGAVLSLYAGRPVE